MYKDSEPRLTTPGLRPAPVEGYLNITPTGYAPYVPELPSRLDRIEPCYQNENNLNIEPLQPRLNIKPQVPMRFDLIKCYFCYIHPSIPFVDKALVTTPQPPSLLLNAIYAAASRFHLCDEPQTNDPPGWSYYKMAFSLIEIYMDTPRLSTVQALLLLIKYHEYVQRPGFFWRTKFLLQLATQMAGDLGISRKPADNSISAHDLEYRNRTFWALYMYETLMSTEHGFKPYFRPAECTAQYPQYVKEQNTDQTIVLNFHWISKVIHVQGFVLQFMRLKYSTDASERFDEQKEFSQLEQTLNNLGQEIPQMVLGNGDTNFYFFYLVYHVAIILLYRPYEASNSAEGAPYNFVCQSSASSITDIVEHIISLKGTDAFYSTARGHQQIIYCLTVAITVQRAAKNMIACLQSFELSQYEKTASILSMLVRKSPVFEIEDVSVPESQLCTDFKKKHDITSSSNTSSARSSPLDPSLSCPQSPSSPKTTKRMSRSSSQFASTPDNMSYASPSSNALIPEQMIYQRAQPTSNRASHAQNRLSAPSLTSLYQQHPYYYPSQIQQSMYQQSIPSPQQPMSNSQPTSPNSQYFTDINGVASSNGVMEQFFNTASSSRRPISRKSSMRRSTSFVGDFVIPIQRPARATSSHPYPNARRHTVTNSVSPDSLDAMMGSGSFCVSNNDLQPVAASNHRYSAPPNTLFPYDIPLATQQVMTDPSFPMDPDIPNTPSESMMRILMNKGQ
ncbi:fungal-specific transcription factor domain-containing protein [Sporodiniella umbellata]|nr:fungal-specific transcription factor domain-containing protein [Sporodiniella umbellata]